MHPHVHGETSTSTYEWGAVHGRHPPHTSSARTKTPAFYTPLFGSPVAGAAAAAAAAALEARRRSWARRRAVARERVPGLCAGPGAACCKLCGAAAASRKDEGGAAVGILRYGRREGADGSGDAVEEGRAGGLRDKLQRLDRGRPWTHFISAARHASCRIVPKRREVCGGGDSWVWVGWVARDQFQRRAREQKRSRSGLLQRCGEVGV